MENMTLGSLFDGIAGWPDAAVRAGVKPLWASEIEPFPAAVSAYHFPDMKQLGDITAINGAEIEPVDIICAGSPCQDLSVAGKRAGLEGARSGLFMEAVRIMREMRNATNGKYPRYFVWENVPGAFSSNRGLDFKAVLEEIGETEIPIPQNGKWANAGLVELPKCDIAWRVLDAQYWGVAQRRRRIFLIADFAETGRSAGEILFECKSLSGDTSESSGTGKRPATTAERGIGTPSIIKLRAGKSGGGKGALVSKDMSLTLSTQNDQTLITGDIYKQSSFGGYAKDDSAGTLRASGGDYGGGTENLVNDRVIGSLCARDYKGIGNQYVDEGKLVYGVQDN